MTIDNDNDNGLVGLWTAPSQRLIGITKKKSILLQAWRCNVAQKHVPM